MSSVRAAFVICSNVHQHLYQIMERSTKNCASFNKPQLCDCLCYMFQKCRGQLCFAAEANPTYDQLLSFARNQRAVHLLRLVCSDVMHVVFDVVAVSRPMVCSRGVVFKCAASLVTNDCSGSIVVRCSTKCCPDESRSMDLSYNRDQRAYIE